jgi:ring-1,2-phenylacetyl-CoA epoxidase subunit PaaC
MLRAVDKLKDCAVARFAARLGDDALIHGQRLCEWSSRAPTLEEDLALANVALDYLGRARLCYTHAGELLGCGEDDFAYLRDARAFENLLLVELPRGDFAFTMLRQYLLDVFEDAYFARLCDSGDAYLAGMAGKACKEIDYHKRRSREWMRRLGHGTDVSRAKLQAAVEALWGYVDELFAMDDLERHLTVEGVAVDREVLAQAWHTEVRGWLEECGVKVPDGSWQVEGGRNGVHTEHLGHLLSEMQFLQRAYPGLQW